MSGWQAWVDYYTASIKQVYDISSMSTSNPCKAVNLAILGEDGKFWASSADFRTEDFKEADIALMLDAINCSEQDTRPCGDENCFMKPPKGFALLNTAEEKGHHILLGKSKEIPGRSLCFGRCPKAPNGLCIAIIDVEGTYNKAIGNELIHDFECCIFKED